MQNHQYRLISIPKHLLGLFLSLICLFSSAVVIAAEPLSDVLRNTDILAIDGPYGVSLVVPADELFSYPDGEVIDIEAYTLLDRMLTVAQAHPNLAISITGHTDTIYGSARRLEISHYWAMQVASYLIQRGVDPERIIQVTGAGARYPLTQVQNLGGRAANRRVEITLHGFIP